MKNSLLMWLLFATSPSIQAQPHSTAKKATTKVAVANPGYFIDTVHYKGKSLYASLLVTGPTAALWLRTRYNKVSSSDIAVATISFTKQTFTELAKDACTAYDLYDNEQTVLACGATLGSVFCALELPAAIAIGDADVIEECQVSWTETLTEDMGTCLSGIGGKVADVFGFAPEFTTYNMTAHLDLGKTKEGLGDAFSLWCKDVEGKSDRDSKDPAHPLGNVLANPSQGTTGQAPVNQAHRHPPPIPSHLSIPPAP